MITNIIKNILTASGCDLVIYEQSQLVNLQTDLSDSTTIVGVIIVPDSLLLEVRANAISEHYDPLVIEILQQARLEDSGDNNASTWFALKQITKEIIVRLIAEATFKTITPVRINRIIERKYDANLIGWSMNIDLYYLYNENRYPCEPTSP